jgi:hypothetical protein
VRIKFDRFPDVTAKPIPTVEKPKLELLEYPKPNAKTKHSTNSEAGSEPPKSEVGINAVIVHNKNAA